MQKLQILMAPPSVLVMIKRRQKRFINYHMTWKDHADRRILPDEMENFANEVFGVIVIQIFCHISLHNLVSLIERYNNSFTAGDHYHR